MGTCGGIILEIPLEMPHFPLEVPSETFLGVPLEVFSGKGRGS